MKYFEFLNNIIDNFRVSKMIEIVKIEQDIEKNELLVVAFTTYCLTALAAP